MAQTTLRTALLAATEQLAAADPLTPGTTARRDAELLLLHLLGRDRAWLLAHADDLLPDAYAAPYAQRLARRARQEPVQYIVGEQEFWGLKLRVTADVLIPRPETEHLVEAALARLPKGQPAKIADIGTGSGAIALALATERPEAQITALDQSPAALSVARENAQRHGVAGQIRFLTSDLLAAVSGERFTMIASNPPYIPSGEQLEAQVRDYEPHCALFAGEDGLAIYRRLIPEAWAALEPGGWLLLEIGHGQRDAVAALLSGWSGSDWSGSDWFGSAWSGIEFLPDLQGIPRVAVAQRPQATAGL